MNPFSYAEYQAIISHLKSTNILLDYRDINDDSDEFCVIRHDVEFSVERALNLARFEKNTLDISTSYLFQFRNNCYNICSDFNLKKVNEIVSLGHSVGLHLHFGMYDSSNRVQDYILQEADLFERISGIKIDRFSYHRPSAEILKQYIEVDSLINCYGKKYFHYFQQQPESILVKYYTDSRHIWQYGNPIDNQSKKVQLLTHPYSWTEEGYNNLDNFSSLLNEKSSQIKHSINDETSTFPKSLLD